MSLMPRARSTCKLWIDTADARAVLRRFQRIVATMPRDIASR
jgi:hypothetical protein